jgi:hypothetical protein
MTEVHHAYLTTGNGVPIALDVLAELCPLCGVSHPNARLGRLREDAFSETVMCTSCDYSLTRPRRPTPGPMRPMNSRNRDSG